MPPKKKDDSASAKKANADEFRDLEKDTELKNELDKVTRELEEAKRRVQSLKDDNEWLEQEAQRINEESQEYMNFMSKKANMRQNSIITLSDHNKQEIENLKQQKENIMKEFELKKQTLQNNLITKQNLLNKVRQEIDEMSQFKELKQTQLEEIASLEKEILSFRQETTKIISELRSEFLKEKAVYKKDAENRIAAIVKAANKEARECLSENTYKIKLENQKLRAELFDLIQATKDLNIHKEKLEKKKSDLLYEIKYAEDLKKVRSTQQKRVLEKLYPNNV